MRKEYQSDWHNLYVYRENSRKIWTETKAWASEKVQRNGQHLKQVPSGWSICGCRGQKGRPGEEDQGPHLEDWHDHIWALAFTGVVWNKFRKTKPGDMERLKAIENSKG